MAEVYGWDLDYIENLSEREVSILLARKMLDSKQKESNEDKKDQKRSADQKRREMLKHG